MKKFLIVFLLFVVNIYGFTYVITPQEMNENINKKFPIETKLFFAKFSFSNPVIKIDKEKNFIIFICDIESPSFVLVDGSTPKIRFFTTSEIKYKNKKIYLKNIVVDKIQNKYLSKKMQEKLILVAEILLNSYFDTHAVYDFENANSSIKAISDVITGIVIDKGVVKILF